MAFTYEDALVSNRDRVRFHIGDTLASAGPKPADANFTDAEIAGLVLLEGSWQRATAAAFENLAALWAKHVTFGADGMSASLSNVAEQYRQLAAEWRQRYGGAETCGSVFITRTDGYSDDLDNVTLDDMTGEDYL